MMRNRAYLWALLLTYATAFVIMFTISANAQFDDPRECNRWRQWPAIELRARALEPVATWDEKMTFLRLVQWDVDCNTKFRHMHRLISDVEARSR